MKRIYIFLLLFTAIALSQYPQWSKGGASLGADNTWTGTQNFDSLYVTGTIALNTAGSNVFRLRNGSHASVGLANWLGIEPPSGQSFFFQKSDGTMVLSIGSNGTTFRETVFVLDGKEIHFGTDSDFRFESASAGVFQILDVSGNSMFQLTDGGTGGGILLGGATGGDQGAGTINAVGLYDDGALVADYVFEEDYSHLGISEMEKFYQDNKHLPTIASRAEWEKKKPSIGQLSTMLWETIEVQAKYIAELNARLEKLETKE